MNREIVSIKNRCIDIYEGTPWHGDSIVSVLNRVEQLKAYNERGKKGHSIYELLLHMINWRLFVISRLSNEGALEFFEHHNWRNQPDASDVEWQNAVHGFRKTQEQLLSYFNCLQDDVLDREVKERTYSFRELLYGIMQHDIYHIGQIAYLLKG